MATSKALLANRRCPLATQHFFYGRWQHNMATSRACGICGMEDSWRHSLIECSISRYMLALVDEEIHEHMITTTKTSAKQWLFEMIESMSRGYFVKSAVTLWATWWARSKTIHEGVFQSPLSAKLFVKSFITELGRCQEGHQLLVLELEIHVDAGLRRDGNGRSAATLRRDFVGN